jgi:REP element-mobilizing transposase RayT
MPRQARLDAPGTLHHVMVRGIERTTIFRDEADRTDFLARVAHAVEQGHWMVYAWALLPNHAHLLVQTGGQSLASTMRRLLTGYVVNFNHRHKRVGHLLQNRYRSIVVEREPYLLELVRYLHLNPLRANLVPTLRALDQYPWTGHGALLGVFPRRWQATEAILSEFGRSVRRARIAYRAFVAAGLPQGARAAFQGGGLVRSAGGWAEVQALRQQGTPARADARILGGGEFVERLLSEVEVRTRQSLRLTRPRPSLEELIRRVCAHAGIPETDLRAGRRTRPVSQARHLLSQLAVRHLGYPGAGLARVLGVTTSAVNRAAWAEPAPGLAEFL